MEIDNPLVYAALVFLHREAEKVSEIRLTNADFSAHDGHLEEGIHFALDPETEDILLRHVKRENDA